MGMMDVSTPSFLVAKDQGFNHDRNRLRIGKLFPNIDKIEILEVDPIDGNNTCPGQDLFLNDIPYQLCNIRIKDQNQRLALVNRLFHR